MKLFLRISVLLTMVALAACRPSGPQDVVVTKMPPTTAPIWEYEAVTIRARSWIGDPSDPKEATAKFNEEMEKIRRGQKVVSEFQFDPGDMKTLNAVGKRGGELVSVVVAGEGRLVCLFKVKVN